MASSSSRETREMRDAHASSVRGILVESGVVLMSAMSIAGVQQTELKANVLDLIRKAGKKDPDWLKTKEAALKRQDGVEVVGTVVAEEFEVKDGLVTAYAGLRLRWWIELGWWIRVRV
jgi:hypothetical protein